MAMAEITVCLSVVTFNLFAILVAVNAFWIYVGTLYQHEPCQLEVKPLSLSNWLIVHGAIHIAVYWVSVLLAALCWICEAAGFLVVPIFLMMLTALFDLAWFIVGIVILVHARDCQHVGSHLWNTLLAAVILAGLAVITTHQASNYVQK